MEKEKAYLIAAPIVVSLICIFLAVNLGIASSQLNTERSKAVNLNAQIANLNVRLSDVESRLDTVRREAEGLRAEAESLRVANRDLTSRLNAASEALEGSSDTSAL